MFADRREARQAGPRGVCRDWEVADASIRLSSCQDQAVNWCEALQRDLPAQRECGILLRPISELDCREMLGNGSKSVFDVVPIQLERLARGIQTSQRNVDVGMFGVEVGYGHPFERSAKIHLDTAHHIPGQPLQVETLAELRGDDQLPEPWIAALLPFKKFRSDIEARGLRGESRFLLLE